MITRFVIRKVTREHYYTDSDIHWTAYLQKAKTFKEYTEAQTFLETLAPDFYSIDKIFKV